MAKHYALFSYDIHGERLCTLYDSSYYMDGAIQDISIQKNVNGWKELSFKIPYKFNNGEYNFRINYLKAEHQIYVYEDGVPDVYCIKAESILHDPKKAIGEYKVNHISEELKAKNLYKYFDDNNGIGTCSTLISRALSGTGWSLGTCDTFYETGGSQEKIRSYSCDTKTGAYNMIIGICDLFQARAEFDGYHKTVSIYSVTHTDGFLELNFGDRLDRVSRKADSSNIITRLYVEGEYGDFGYVGIDSASGNTTGLPFILNFDYYKEIGAFHTNHQSIVDNYIVAARNKREQLTTKGRAIDILQHTLTEELGSRGYVFAPIVNGHPSTSDIIYHGSLEDEEKGFHNGDKVAIVGSGGSYLYANPYSTTTTYTGSYAIKFCPELRGRLAVYEDLISTAQDEYNAQTVNLQNYLQNSGYDPVPEPVIVRLEQIYGTTDLTDVIEEDYDTTGLPEQYALSNTREFVARIGKSYNLASSSTNSRNSMMLDVINNVQALDILEKQYAVLLQEQDQIEENFSNDMGPMLRDGYWSDDNYTIGQEDVLYADALVISQKMAYPIVEYKTNTRTLIESLEFPQERYRLAQEVRIYDPDLKINVRAIITEIVEKPEKRMDDRVEMSTDLLNIGGKTFSTMIERVTGLANILSGNKDIYDRASAFTKEKTLPSELLEGTISYLTTKLSSTASNWTTDDNGNIIFTSLDDSSAMMLCGAGFMIASAKKADGSWDWRTFGTGEGFTADAIITGFLSAERIMAGSITVDKVSSSFGESLELSSNESILIAVKNDLDTSASLSVLNDSIVATVTSSTDYTSLVSEVGDLGDDYETLSGVVGDANSGLVKQVNEATAALTPEQFNVRVGQTQVYQTLSGNVTDVANDLNTLDGEVDTLDNTINNPTNGLLVRMNTAEQTITPTAIVNTVTSSTQYQQDFQDLNSELSGEISDVAGDLSTLEGVVGDSTTGLVHLVSVVEQTADKIYWLVEDSATATSSTFTLTSYAAELISDSIDLVANDSVNILITNKNQSAQVQNNANINQHLSSSSSYKDLESKVVNNSLGVSGLRGDVEDINANIDTMYTWFSFSDDGFTVGKEGSLYTTLTDNTGFHILQSGGKISSFAKRRMTVEEVCVGELEATSKRCILREGYRNGLIDGLIIVVEGI